MKHIAKLLSTGRITAASLLVFGLASAALAGSHSATHLEGYEAMSMKDDLAHRSPDISDETLMHRGHDLWLTTLKWMAEAK
jgi:hypothetical protein